MTQQDFWQDEKLWAEPAWGWEAGLSLRDQWKQAAGELAAYIESTHLEGREDPSTLAEAWMKRAVNNLIAANPDMKQPPSFYVHMVASDVAGSKDIGWTMNLFDVIPLKTSKVPSP